ncbi:MOSC N-terminal beta barrel domain-containing protein [Streptomyces sp. NPDC059696]|uniref:MOSC N-terminal beta barrel domain-containing protein n=1 Tax=Streptomyces sp. NPDC059696 TaxID=3346911 RepID=UPI0036BE9BF9
MARVAELSYYPVKGCAGTSIREALLTPAGPAHDRSFMVVSEEGVYRTQRRNPLPAVIRPRIRCAVTLVDQHTGTRAGPEPLRTLATYRRARQGGIAFGTKYAVLRPGTVAVGDEVEVVEWRESEL